jgi:competence protein ComEC
MSSTGLYIFTCAYCLVVIPLVLAHPHAAYVCACLAVLVSVLIARCRQMPWIRLLIYAILAIGLAFARFHFIPQEVPEVFRDLFDHKQALTGTVVTLPDIRETSERVTVDLVSGTQHTRIIASVPLYPGVHAGDRVEVSGTLKHPEPFDTDGGRVFAYDQFLRKDGVFGTMQPAQVRVIGRSDSLWLSFLRMLEHIKTALISFLNLSLPDPENSLAVGILVGGKQGLGQELLDAFGKAGLLQIVVLSGYNVMIVANTLMRLLGKLPTNMRFLVGSLSIACFVLIAGAGSSALRAGLMAFLAIAARTFGKEYDVLQAVAGSVLVLGIWNPLLLAADPGFQFSFIATLGLVLYVPIIAPQLAFLKSAAIVELISTTLAAEITLLPLLLWQTGNLSVVSVAANVIAMPAIPFVMAASAVAMLVAWPLSLIHPVLPLIAGLPAYLPLAYVIQIATLFASLPFATVILPAFPFWIAVVSYAALGALYLRARQPRPGSGAPQRPSSDSRERRQHTSSSLPACSRS